MLIRNRETDENKPYVIAKQNKALHCTAVENVKKSWVIYSFAFHSMTSMLTHSLTLLVLKRIHDKNSGLVLKVHTV